jgi:hypothetical protein
MISHGLQNLVVNCLHLSRVTRCFSFPHVIPTPTLPHPYHPTHTTITTTSTITTITTTQRAVRVAVVNLVVFLILVLAAGVSIGIDKMTEAFSNPVPDFTSCQLDLPAELWNLTVSTVPGDVEYKLGPGSGACGSGHARVYLHSAKRLGQGLPLEYVHGNVCVRGCRRGVSIRGGGPLCLDV